MPRSRSSKKTQFSNADDESKVGNLQGAGHSSDDTLGSDVIYRPRRLEDPPPSKDRTPPPAVDERPSRARVPPPPESATLEPRSSASLPKHVGGRPSETPSVAIFYHHERRRSRLYERHRKIVRSMCPLRYIIVVMASAGLAIGCGLRTAIDVAFLVMINHSAIDKVSESKDGVCNNEHIPRKDGPFAWDQTTQRVLVLSYNLGMLASQIPGAFMAYKSSIKWTMFIAVLIELILAAVFPFVVMNTDWGVVSFILLFQGFCAGIVIPCLVKLIANWAHPKERSTFCGIVFAGQPLGQLCAMLSFYILHKESWQFNFSYMLLYALPWLILWPLWSSSSPVASELISPAERSGILSAQRGTRSYGKLHFPFKQIRASPAVWVLTSAHFGSACISYMIIHEMPYHFHEVLLVHYEQMPVWIFPPVAMLVVCVASGIFIDYLQKRKLYDMKLTRKIGATIAGMMVPAVCLLGLVFVLVCKVATVMILLVIAAGSLGALPAAVLVNHVDLTPNFAGALMGATSALANIPQFVIPTIMGSLFINGHDSPQQRWTSAFTTASVVSITTCIAFVVWGRADVQYWNAGRPDALASGDLTTSNYPRGSLSSRPSDGSQTVIPRSLTDTTAATTPAQRTLRASSEGGFPRPPRKTDEQQETKKAFTGPVSQGTSRAAETSVTPDRRVRQSVATGTVGKPSTSGAT